MKISIGKHENIPREKSLSSCRTVFSDTLKCLRNSSDVLLMAAVFVGASETGGKKEGALYLRNSSI